EFRQIVEAALESAFGFEENVRVVHPNGTVRLVHAVGRAKQDEAGHVVGLFGTLQDVTEKKHLEEKVRHQAFHDSLTGLPNRALFLDRVEHARARQLRGSKSLAVLFLDLDDFKTVNDSKGHKAGDSLLIEVGQRFTSLLRPSDTVARLGGDEFAILLEEIEALDDATHVVERVMTALHGDDSSTLPSLDISASVGIVVEAPTGARSADELLRDSDIAMYVAKKKSKDRYEIFDSAMRDELSARMELKVDLQRALENDELFLQYQPIITLDGRSIEGLEALVRWQHPTRGIVPPGEFIPFAEESGQIVELGRWVLRQACADAVRWQARGDREEPLRVSVNVSASRFRHADFITELREVLGEFQVAPGSLVLEITENVLIKDSEVVAEKLAQIRELGVRLAIDDFGTGYSSLGYLRDFPIDLLKIDKSFIDNVASGPEESALARAVVKLGDALGLSVVAEGVEREEQSDILAAMGCQFAQGFLYARPMDRDKVDELLASEAELVPAAV
ncbi:MAG: EAL domain-containing protein, partial [Actinomycetota bacterium]